MTEIDIILNTSFIQDSNNTFNLDDKIIFYEKINHESKFFNYKNQDINSYHLNGFINNDNWLDFLDSSLSSYMDVNDNKSQFNKKVNLKNLLNFCIPEISINHLQSLKSAKNKKIIVSRDDIILPFPILTKVKELKRYIIVSANNEINVLKLSINRNLTYNNVKNNLFKQVNDEMSYSLNNIVDKQNTLSSSYSNSVYTLLNHVLRNSELRYKNMNLSILIELETNRQNRLNEFNKQNVILNDLSIEYNKFLKVHTNSNNIVDTYNCFWHENLQNLFEDIIVYGINDTNISNRISQLKLQEIEYKKYINSQNYLYKSLYEKSKLESICKKKFPNLFNPNTKECIFNKSIKFDISLLPKKISNLVKLEFEKDMKFIKSTLDNKCAHMTLYNKFKLEKNDEIKKELLKDLEKYISDQSNNSIITCKLCNFNLICPHELFFYNIYFSKSSENQNADYAHNRMLNKFMSNVPVNMYYYCKICGEELGKSSDMEGVNFNNKNYNTYITNDDDSLSSFVYRIVMSYMKITKLNISLTKIDIINYIKETISPIITNIEKATRKNKNINNPNSVININIILFTLSSLISMSTIYPWIDIEYKISDKKNKSKSVKGEREVGIIIKKGSKEDILKTRFVTAYTILSNSFYKLIHELGYDKNKETLKELLLKSYIMISPIIKNKTDSLMYEKVDNITKELIMNSNIYKYYYNSHIIYNSKLSTNTTKSPTLFYLKTNNEDIKKFEYERNNNFKYNDVEKILDIKNFKDEINNIYSKSILTQFKIEELKKINNYYEYQLYSFLLFNYFIHKQLYTVSPYHYKTSTLKDDYIIFIEKSKLVKEFEQTLKNKNLLYTLYPFSNKGKLSNARYYYYKNYDLTTYICEKTGKHHNYKIYIYIDSEKKEHIFKSNEIDKNLDKIKKLKFINYKCTNCHKLKFSSGAKVTNNDLIKTINENNDIINFYNIYKYKCPEDKYHDFVLNKSDNIYKCKLCNIDFDKVKNKDKDFYKKYKNDYNLFMTENRSNSNKLLNRIKKEIKTNNHNDFKLLELLSKAGELNDLYKKIEAIILTHLNNEDDIISIVDNSQNVTKTNINIQILYLLSQSESKIEEEISIDNSIFNSIDEKIENTKLLNVFVKLIEHIRNMMISINVYNNYHKNKQYSISINETLLNIIENKIKKINIQLIDLDDIKKYIYSHSDNIKNKYNSIVKYLLYIIMSIYNIDNSFGTYLLKNIFNTERLYTKFNFLKLKQMFVNTNANDDNDLIDDDMYDDGDDGDNLFDSSDLGFNNMEDDNIDDD